MPAYVSTNRLHTGFTLLEILVAVSIFSIMSVVALAGIKAILDSQEATDRVGAQMKSLQKTFFYFDQDLRYAIARDIRDEFGDPQGAMVAGNAGPQGLALTRIGIGNLQGVKRSSMVRVRYWLKEDTLMRSTYKTIDRAGEADSLDRILIDKIEELEFRFLGPDKQWQPSWPPLNPTAGQKALPQAIELNLTHEQLGKITRIIPLSGY
jgi:general secretion pathway protein J